MQFENEGNNNTFPNMFILKKKPFIAGKVFTKYSKR